MKDGKVSDVGKELLGLYLSRFQREAFRRSDESRKVDLSWPFKFVWSILAGLWGFFPPKRERPPMNSKLKNQP